MQIDLINAVETDRQPPPCYICGEDLLAGQDVKLHLTHWFDSSKAEYKHYWALAHPGCYPEK